MGKVTDIQPWLDYFELLQTYEQKGFLEVAYDKHEAFITRAALYTLADTTSGSVPVGSADGEPAPSSLLPSQTAVGDSVADPQPSSIPSPDGSYAAAVFAVARRIRTYAAFSAQQGPRYFSWTFALHVVHEDAPHDLIYTLLLSRRRRWWWPFRETESIEMIEYESKKQQ